MKEEGKFYSVWRREKTPLGIFHKFAAQKGKGHYVGTIHQAQGLRPGMTLFFEGDDSTYVDNKMRLHGTGSEDIYNGGMVCFIGSLGQRKQPPPSMVAWIIRFRWPEPVDTVSSWPTKCPMRRKSIMEWNMVK